MKQFLLYTILILFALKSNSQSLNYNDLGVLLSNNNNNGTSRFNSMSGAFGALGSDVSSIYINPAGGAIARKSKISFTINNTTNNGIINYYNANKKFENENFNFSQAGGIFIYNLNTNNWNRFALSLNYRVRNNYNNNFIIGGSGDYLNFTMNPNENNKEKYDSGIYQKFSRLTSGMSSEFNIGFSAVHDKNLSIGGSINIVDFNFHETSKLNEKSEDVNNNKIYAFNVQESSYIGNGFSLNFGLIYKIKESIRLGLAYETPTWFQDIVEDTNLSLQDEKNIGFPGYIEIETTDPDGSNPITYKTPNTFNTYNYSFRYPSRLTISGAYVFGKKGLISADYTFKNYKSFKFKNGDFQDVNQSFYENYRNSQIINIGSEWRFKKISIRAGYHYQTNPNLLLGAYTNKDNYSGFSVGIGYNFGNILIDLSYSKSKNTDFYKLYELNDLNINNSLNNISGTITLNL